MAKKAKKKRTPVRAHKLITDLTTKLAMIEVRNKLIKSIPPKTPDIGLGSVELE